MSAQSRTSHARELYLAIDPSGRNWDYFRVSSRAPGPGDAEVYFGWNVG